MDQRFCSATLLCSLTLIAVPVMAENDQNFLQRKADENKMSRMYEMFRKQDSEITFYGKVIDQNGDSVEGADIEIHVKQFDPDMDKLFGQVKTVHVQTGATGLFSLEKEKGRSIYVEGISKAGYEYLMAQNPSSFQYSEDAFPKPFVADRNAPVVFKLRKRGPTTFLIVSPSGNRSPDELFWTKGTNSVTQPLDLLTWISGPGWKHCATPEADLRIDATFDAERKSWTVTYAATNGAEGTILSDSLLYEAPGTGYTPCTTVVVTNQERGCYLYLKSRTPAVYSCVFFNHRFNDRGDLSLRLYCKAWINPYGERNLEYETAMEAQYLLRKQMEREIKADFRQNKRPGKPDLPRRIKEFNEKLQKEKAEKASANDNAK